MLQSGTFVRRSGKRSQGYNVSIKLNLAGHDDGQRALDAALQKQGVLMVRIPGQRFVLTGELEPYTVKVNAGPKYTVEARLIINNRERIQ